MVASVVGPAAATRDSTGSAGSGFEERVRELLESGSYAQAESLARVLLASAESTGDSTHVASALDLLVSALLRSGKETRLDTRELAGRAVRLRETATPLDSAALAGSLSLLGRVFHEAADYPRARQLYERALLLREAALGSGHPRVSYSLIDLAQLLHETGEPAQSRPLYERALEILEKALGSTHVRVAVALNALGNVAAELGDYPAAIRSHQRALSIREAALGDAHPEVAMSLMSLAIGHGMSGSYAAALPLHERALRVFRESLGDDHFLVGYTLANLANVQHSLGDYTRSRALFEEVIRRLTESRGPAHPDVARALSALGNTLHAAGHYAAARSALEQAMSLQERGFGADHPDVAHSLRDLSSLQRSMGDHRRARESMERAVAIYEKRYGPEHPDVAAAFDDLGTICLETGDRERAKTLYERALSLREKSFGAGHEHVASSLYNLAGLMEESDDDAGAKSLHERALAIRDSALGSEHPDVASTLTGLAGVMARMGDTTAAESHLDRSLKIREKTLGSDHPKVGEVLARQATLWDARGDRGRALSAALRADEMGREHVRLTSRVLTEREALRYAAARVSGLNVALRQAEEGAGPETLGAAWDALIRSRALVLDEMAARHRTVVDAADTAVQRLRLALGSARERLANLTIRGPGGETPSVHRRLLDDARAEKERAEQALAERSAAFRGERARDRIGFEDVARSLDAADGLVAFAEHEPTGERPRHGDTPTPGLRRADRRLIAFVLRGGGRDPAAVSLGEAGPVDSLVARWRAAVSGEAVEARGSGQRELGEALRRRLWDPVAAHLTDARRVFVVPDGSINLVSLAALPAGERDYLVERGPTFHYLSAERDLAAWETPAAPGGGLLAIGGPAYDATHPSRGAQRPRRAGPSGGPREEEATTAVSRPYRGSRSSCGDSLLSRFEPLPGSEREVREVGELWRRGGGSGATVVVGADASEAAFKTGAPGRQVIHVATHGFFLGGACVSALARGAASEGPGPDRGPPLVTGENPLLLSGLVLSGANLRTVAGPAEEDGILTAEEIAALDLTGLEWAVLSACDVGTGQVMAGEGVLGLRRAFQVTGARTLIMSLWKVEDAPTRLWMRALYEARLGRRLSTAEAVREASLAALRERRARGDPTDPASWGAFIAAGDWR